MSDPIEMAIAKIQALEVMAVSEMDRVFNQALHTAIAVVKGMPSAQPTKEIPKRVLWSGWKGCRDTRYKCPNCKKPVRNDDAYCHKCGQRLMFPKISFTDYVPGEKQDVIVRWDDEERFNQPSGGDRCER